MSELALIWTNIKKCQVSFMFSFTLPSLLLLSLPHLSLITLLLLLIPLSVNIIDYTSRLIKQYCYNSITADCETRDESKYRSSIRRTRASR